MIIISHRGAKGLAPENTKASFEAALKTKADMIEFDVRTSADGKLVINHDSVINGLAIASTTYKSLHAAYPELLTFEDLLDIIDNKRPLLVEIKPGADIQVIIASLKKLTLPKGSWLGSFDYKILKALRSNFPDAELLVLHKWSGIIARQRARVVGTKKIALNQRWLYKAYIRALSRGGFQLILYTLNDLAKTKSWARAGLYGCVTDYPERYFE